MLRPYTHSFGQMEHLMAKGILSWPNTKWTTTVHDEYFMYHFQKIWNLNHTISFICLFAGECQQFGTRIINQLMNCSFDWGDAKIYQPQALINYRVWNTWNFCANSAYNCSPHRIISFLLSNEKMSKKKTFSFFFSCEYKIRAKTEIDFIAVNEALNAKAHHSPHRHTSSPQHTIADGIEMFFSSSPSSCFVKFRAKSSAVTRFWTIKINIFGANVYDTHREERFRVKFCSFIAIKNVSSIAFCREINSKHLNSPFQYRRIFEKIKLTK